jgi:hypothetical protein
MKKPTSKAEAVKDKGKVRMAAMSRTLAEADKRYKPKGKK